MAVTTKETIALLLESYSMELETVVNYLANSVNLDGVRAEEIKKSLGGDVLGEITHAQQLANRIKQIGGHIPGSKDLTLGKQIQPVTETTDVVGVIRSVIATNGVSKYSPWLLYSGTRIRCSMATIPSGGGSFR